MDARFLDCPMGVIARIHRGFRDERLLAKARRVLRVHHGIEMHIEFVRILFQRKILDIRFDGCDSLAAILIVLGHRPRISTLR